MSTHRLTLVGERGQQWDGQDRLECSPAARRPLAEAAPACLVAGWRKEPVPSLFSERPGGSRFAASGRAQVPGHRCAVGRSPSELGDLSARRAGGPGPGSRKGAGWIFPHGVVGWVGVAAVEIRLFGPLEVVVDGRVQPIAGQGERSLLAALACSAGRVVPVDRLIDDLWGEDLPANPANALQVRVSKLRRQLGGFISTTSAGYVLDVDPAGVDLHRFTQLVSTGRFQEALALYRGPPLAEFGSQEWARAEAARLEELYLAAVEADVEERLRRGGDVALVADLEGLVAAHPLRERLRGQLMLALHRSGRSADALACYQEGRRLLRDELGLDPSDELRQLEGAILRQEATLQGPERPARPPTNLPARLSSFIGREADLARVAETLASSRLVTLTGPGGAGKTSLAIEASREAADSYRDGVWFVPLAGVTDPARVASAMAETLGIADPGAPAPRELLTAWFSQREALLVLDNCEHLIDACAGLVEHLLGTAAPGGRIMTTSREALGVPGEVQLPVPPLGDDDAVALFADRAASIHPGFTLGPDEPVVRHICQQLDGMPLAIELAAARVNMLPVAEIARRLDDRFRLLTGGARTAEARHRTLRATIDWSYELLTEPQRILLRRLAVFRGWTLQAAEAVCAGGAVASGDVLDLLGGLVERSLVVARGGRFRLLETIRQYAAERLAEAGEEEALRERHARHFLELAEQAEPQLRGPKQSRWLERLRAEDDNFQLALRWCRERAAEDPDLGLRLAAALGWYWYVGRQIDGRRELGAMLDAVSKGSAIGRARVLQALSLALRPAGCIVHPSSEAAEAARQSLSLFTGTEDRSHAAISRLLLAVEGVAGGDVARWLGEVEAARAALRDEGDRWGEALADFVEMEILLRNGADERALSLGESAARAFEELGDDWGRSAVPMHLGAGLRLVGRPRDAVAVLNRALQVCRAAGLENNVARVYAELGGAAADVGDAAEAERWYAECERVARSLANDTMLTLAWLGHGMVARLRRDAAGACKWFGDALEVTTQAGVVTQAVVAMAGLAAAQLDAGEVAEAAATLARAAHAAGEVGEAGVRAAVLEQRARLALARSHDSEAAALLAEAESLRQAARRPPSALQTRDVEEAAAGSAVTSVAQDLPATVTSREPLDEPQGRAR
jgi:predicted ATPase/DNA-binding SARP family transcriptional activator